MPYLAAAVVFVGVIACADLVLTYGVIRRLREHTRRLADLPGTQQSVPDLMIPAGSEPGEFPDAVATDGRPVTRADLADLLIGFFTPGCDACVQRAPGFVERAGRLDRDRVLVVVAAPADHPEVAALVAQFEPVARVVVEPDRGPLQQAFDVTGYPAMCLTSGDGRVAASSWKADGLPEPAVTATR